MLGKTIRSFCGQLGPPLQGRVIKGKDILCPVGLLPPAREDWVAQEGPVVPRPSLLPRPRAEWGFFPESLAHPSQRSISRSDISKPSKKWTTQLPPLVKSELTTWQKAGNKCDLLCLPNRPCPWGALTHCPSLFAVLFPSAPRTSPPGLPPSLFPLGSCSSPTAPASSSVAGQNNPQLNCGMRLCPYSLFPSLPSPGLFFSHLSFSLLFVFGELESIFAQDLHPPCPARGRGSRRWHDGQEASLAFSRRSGALPALEMRYDLGGFLFFSRLV